MEHYIIAYDIKDDKRRTRIFQLLKSFATHVQYSIFEAYISAEDVVRLRYKLRKAMNMKEDSIFLYRLCAKCGSQIERFGAKIDIYGKDDIII